MPKPNKKSKKVLSNNISGTIKRHPDGFGFFIADNPDIEDVFLSRREMNGVMSGDRIAIDVHRSKMKGKTEGKLIEILQRNTQRAVGPIHILSPGKGIIIDQSHAWGADLIVLYEDNSKIEEGIWVSARIESYPESSQGFVGNIETIIGKGEDPKNDSLRVLLENEIPLEFHKQSLKELDQWKEEVETDLSNRRKDLSKEYFVTIDGVTAKDFDDAIFVQTNSSGFLLKVAIADVSHYVKPGTALNEDAYIRGNSTYFPNFVAPMLPPKLSENLCSLKPNVARLALVSEIQFDFEGVQRSSKFYEAIIQSHERLTYGKAQDIIDGDTSSYTQGTIEAVENAKNLAKLLMQKRFKDGALNLEIPETEIEIDGTGHVVDIFASHRQFSHKLIEELMLAANVAVAKFFTEKDVPAIYRIHDEPKPAAIETLEKYLLNFGAKKKLGTSKLQKRISKALENFVGTPQEQILNILTLRSMSQAQYSANNIGHFGLGFDDYTHFTSPIRRYSDLVVHRTLKALIGVSGDYKLVGVAIAETMGAHLSSTEQRSVKAERQFQGIKKARFMEEHIGEEFEAIITSVAKFGVFALLRKYEVDGLLPTEALPGGPFHYDEEHLRLIGKKTGLEYKIGDSIQIQVAAVDTTLGRIDFVIPNEGVREKLPKKKGKSAQGRRKAKNNRRRFR